MSQIEREYEVDPENLVKEEPVEKIWYDQTYEYHKEEMLYSPFVPIRSRVNQEMCDNYVCEIDDQRNKRPDPVQYGYEVAQK